MGETLGGVGGVFRHPGGEALGGLNVGRVVEGDERLQRRVAGDANLKKKKKKMLKHLLMKELKLSLMKELKLFLMKELKFY